MKKFLKEHMVNERGVAKTLETRKLIMLFSLNVDVSTCLGICRKTCFLCRNLVLFHEVDFFVSNCKELEQG